MYTSLFYLGSQIVHVKKYCYNGQAIFVLYSRLPVEFTSLKVDKLVLNMDQVHFQGIPVKIRHKRCINALKIYKLFLNVCSYAKRYFNATRHLFLTFYHLEHVPILYCCHQGFPNEIAVEEDGKNECVYLHQMGLS